MYYHYSMVSCFFQLNLAMCMVFLPKQQSPAYVQQEVRLPQGGPAVLFYCSSNLRERIGKF